jgi:transaldolase/glucose-6-phosphate isomerase
LAPLGAWIEQLVAESTGKDGRGILPVDGETLTSPDAYENDRVFVSVSAGSPDAATTRALDALEAAGHPVLRWERNGTADLGAEFLRWELVTAVAGAVIDVDPFDEPNVAEAKAATKAGLDTVRAQGALPASTPRATDGALELHAPAALELAGSDVREWARALARLTRPGDYAAILAFLHRTGARQAAIERVRHAWRAAARVATTVGYGPRYLHSTGQLHKGGPATGVFLQLTVEDGDEPIPGESYGFRTLRDAQAAGDLDVLARRGRRAARVHLRGDADAGLAKLAEAFEALAGS